MTEQVNPADLVADGKAMEDLEGFNICPKCKAVIIQGKCNCVSGNVEVEAKAAEVAGAQTTPPVEGENLAEDDAAQQESPIPAFTAKDALKELPGAPSEAQINAWKAQHGQIYVFPFDVKEMYIWRPLRRREYQVLKTNNALMEDEEKFQEQVVLRAVLWPEFDPVSLNVSRAGLVQTLYGVIMQGSYFLHPDFAVQLVQEL